MVGNEQKNWIESGTLGLQTGPGSGIRRFNPNGNFAWEVSGMSMS
jgi:hypothetical protein